MVLGLLPISILVGPLMSLGLLLVTVTVIFSVAYGVNPFRTSDGSLQLFLSVFAGAVGLWALWWTFLFGPAQIRLHATLHKVIALSLLAGIAADLYWFRQVGHGTDPHWYVKPVWFSVLIGPMVLGIKYLFLLLRQRNVRDTSTHGAIPGD